MQIMYMAEIGDVVGLQLMVALHRQHVEGGAETRIGVIGELGIRLSSALVGSPSHLRKVVSVLERARERHSGVGINE